MFDKTKLKNISAKIKDKSPPILITFHPAKEKSEIFTALFELTEIIRRMAGNGIKLQEGNGKGLPAVPALTLTLPGGGTVNYLAVPADKEAEPFFELLTSTKDEVQTVSADIKQQIQALDQPFDMQIFITSTCPNCPNAVRSADSLTLLNERITTTIIDVEHFPELGEHYHVQSVPMIVINNELLINKVIPTTFLAEKLLKANSEEFRREGFISLINSRNFDLAAKKLLSSDRYLKYFLSAWKNSDLSSRMGLMLLAEQVLAQTPMLFSPIVPKLIDIFRSENESLVGDTADLLGQIGDKEAIKPLQALLKHENTDIVEIAEEALAAIESSTDD